MQVLRKLIASFQLKEHIAGSAVDAAQLNRFVLLTHLDLKKFVFYYWFAFPALSSTKATLTSSPLYLKDILGESARRKFEKLFYELDHNSNNYFLALATEDAQDCTLHDINQLEPLAARPGRLLLCFADPATGKEPGWPLRNFLTFVASKCPTRKQWTVVGVRTKAKCADFSLVLDVELEAQSSDCIKTVGWEKNEKQKLLPRMVDMSAMLDPQRLAQNAVNLNLKLMRWRLVPALNLEKIAATKCLLLGAGTLGCNVARALLGWGVEHITLVDNGKVSYSNPVRQSLFTFEDCLSGGKPKAQAAADALKLIYPNIQARGVELSIPMPGHFLSDPQGVKNDVQKLEALVQEHDCVFLLMDTRESRWLPTVLGQVYDKVSARLRGPKGADRKRALFYGFLSRVTKVLRRFSCEFYVMAL